MSLKEVSPLVWGNFTLEKKDSLFGHLELLKAFGVGSFRRTFDLIVHPLVQYFKLEEDWRLVQCEVSDKASWYS